MQQIVSSYTYTKQQLLFLINPDISEFLWNFDSDSSAVKNRSGPTLLYRLRHTGFANAFYRTMTVTAGRIFLPRRGGPRQFYRGTTFPKGESPEMESPTGSVGSPNLTRHVKVRGGVSPGA